MEYWDIYDENKQLTGRTMKRDDWNMQPGDYHLTVLGAVMRPDGTFLITRRAADKPWAALCWEIPGGACVAGETSLEAVRREVREETGVDVSDAKGGYVFSYRRDNPDERNNYFVDIFRFELDVKDEDVKLQIEESCDFAFASPEKIKELAGEGKFLHYDSIKEIFNR